MRRGTRGALLALAALAAAAGAAAQPATVAVTGAAILRERIMPPPGTALRVTLHEAEGRGADALGAVVASASVPVEGGRIPFTLEAERDALVFGTDYALALRLEGPGAPVHAAGPLRLRPDGRAESAAGEITLRGGLPPLALAARFVCEDGLTARAGDLGGALVLEIGGARFAALPARTASGAKIAAAEDPESFLWSKGGEAIVSRRGEERVGCAQVEAEPAAPGAAALAAGEWVVEDLDGGGVIDASRVTLVFEVEEGRVSGRGGCNAWSSGFAANGTAEAGALSVRPAIATTMMACAEALAMQERRFLDLLPRLRAWRLDESGALILTAGDGARLLARR